MGNTDSQAFSFAYYEFVAKEFEAIQDWVFMNYGYADLNEPPEGQPQNHSEALYAQVVDTVPLTGLSVLEVGCGRGGGAAYIAKKFQPRSLIGVDFSPHLVQFCRRNYSIEGLQFLNAEAGNLPFQSNTFDVVINVESSHSYEREDKFLRGVARVLKPDGYFLFADFRERHLVSDLLKKIADAGLSIIMQKEITKNVLHALTLDSQVKAELIRKHCPAVLIPLFLNSAAVIGTIKHTFFLMGLWRYFHIVAKKQE